MSRNHKICIIDYGGGNTQSVFNVFESMGIDVVLSVSEQDLDNASHLVLPGVGAFDVVMNKLRKTGIVPFLEDCVLQQKKPFLGICVGMQILAEKGFEHGEWDGLGWVRGVVEKMDPGELILPHMGWNNIRRTNNNCPLFENFGDNIDFYFVHSYFFNAAEKKDVCAIFEYSKHFTAAIQRDNIFGVQFHPEKSQKAGKALLKNFIEMA